MLFSLHRLTKRRLITLNFLVAALLLLGGLGLLVNLLDRQQNDQAWVEHTYQVIDQLKAVEAYLADAETGTRGYVATGNRSFLQPYYQTLPRLATTLQTLPRLVADNPAQRRRVLQLDRLVRAKMTIVNQLIRPTPSAQALLSIGKQRMDAVREQVAVISRVEQELMRARQQELQTDYGVTSRLVWLLIAMALANGAWSYWLVSREFSRRQRAEQRLQSSQQRYRSLVDHLKVVVFQTDANGHWTYLNPVWEKVTGFSVDASLGGSLVDSVLEEDRPDIQRLLERIQADGAPGNPLQIRFLHQSGDYRWFDVLLDVNRNAQQQFMGLTGSLIDRTEGKQAAEALVESEQRFRAIAENVDEIFWIRDVQRPVFLYINPTFERYTGIRPETAYANPLAFAGAVVEEDRPSVLEAFNSPQPSPDLRFRIHHPDGSLRWLNAHIFTQKNEAGVLTRRMGVATDITATLEKERLLEESLAAERNLNALKSQFIATASHQFRTPLTAISLCASLIQRYAQHAQPDALIPKIHKQVNTIHQQVQSLTDLISDTLTLSKIEAGKIQVEWADTDLVELSEAVAGLLGNREDGRHVEMTVSGEPVQMRADKKLLSHVLANLLSNAFKFSSDNPHLSIRYASHEVRILVRDRGVGIPQAELPYLFSKFFRASNTTNIPGTGLGLAICQEYLALQQGRIEVDSTVGEGTEFTVILKVETTTEPGANA
jgi:PAS domain S-box-containing protein